MAKVEPIKVRCPASDAVGLPRCAETFTAKYSPEYQAFEGSCRKHGAMRLLPGLAESCGADAAKAPASTPAAVDGGGDPAPKGKKKRKR